LGHAKELANEALPQTDEKNGKEPSINKGGKMAQEFCLVARRE
jgi:hypothetical protein